MAYSPKILKEAETHLEKIRKEKIQESETRKKILYQRFKRAAEIDVLLSKTAICAAKSVLEGANAKEELLKLKKSNFSLQKELNDILNSAGLPLDYLEIKYNCSHCNDTGYINGKICDCLKKTIKQIAYEKLNKLSPLSLSTFESFNLSYYPRELTSNGIEPRAKMEKIFKFCKDYAYNFSKDSKNLFMQGATGLGKTHLSLAIASTVIDIGYNVIYTSTPSIISKLEKERFNHINSEDNSENHLIECDLLILDDLGTEFQTSFSNATVYNIINTRIMYRRPTIISTNLSAKEIQNSYSQRLVSRIMGNYIRLYFLGHDIRQHHIK